MQPHLSASQPAPEAHSLTPSSAKAFLGATFSPYSGDAKQLIVSVEQKYRAIIKSKNQELANKDDQIKQLHQTVATLQNQIVRLQNQLNLRFRSKSRRRVASLKEARSHPDLIANAAEPFVASHPMVHSPAKRVTRIRCI